jgi:hypothetical protein
MVVSNSISSSNTLKFDDVVGVILSEEMRWKITSETSGNAFNRENMGRQEDRGKGSRNCLNSRKGRSKYGFGRIEFWNCGKKDNIAPKKQRYGQQDKKSRSKCKR